MMFDDNKEIEAEFLVELQTEGGYYIGEPGDRRFTDVHKFKAYIETLRCNGQLHDFLSEWSNDREEYEHFCHPEK